MMAETKDVSPDASAGQSAENRREVKLGQTLEALIERGGYSRNRKKISSRLGISSAALSQYIRQQTWPSFAKLLAIADFFDVSLDYLVYGQPAGSSVIDYGPLYRYVDHALADVQARGSRHTAVVARIGRMLADRLDEEAKELAAKPGAAREGLMQDDEQLRLDQRWDANVGAFRQLLAGQIGGDRVRENCSFRLTAAPVMTGILLYQVDTARLQSQEPALLRADL
jgi:transcriptional regulator with XRE-family HTH domain